MATDYYLRDTNVDTGCDSTGPFDLSKATGTTATDTISTTGLTVFTVVRTFDIDVSGDSPSGTSHTVTVDIATISNTNVRWRVQEINSGCSVVASSGYSTTYTTTGTKSDVLTIAAWSTGTRLRLSVEAQEAASHGTRSVGITVNVTSKVAAPWTALSAIGESLALQYNIRNAIGESLALQYHIRNAIGESVALVYNILSDLTAIGESLALPYNIRNAIGESVALVYHIRNEIGESVALQYHIRNAIGESLVIQYNILAPRLVRYVIKY